MRRVFQIEFAVQMGGPGCEKTIREALKDIEKIEINTDEGRVVVNTTVPWIEVQEKIEATGKRAVLSGFGGFFRIFSLD